MTLSRSLTKVGLREPGARKARGSPTFRQIREGEGVFGGVEVGIEVVSAELVEVAENNEAGAVGNEAGPVIEGLAVVFLEVLAALFHFDEHDGFPNIIGEGGAAAVLVGFAEAEFGGAADVQTTGLAKGLKEAIQKDLGLAFFVAGDVFPAPRGKFSEFFPARHGEVLQENQARGQC